MGGIGLPGKVVTSTDFIRNFGLHARAAGGEPVHILNYGRPALSLVNTDYLNQLSGGPARGDAQGQRTFEMVFDQVAALVVLFDRALRIVRVNRSALQAVAVFEEDLRGTPAAALLADSRHHFVLRALERVRDSGQAESFEFDAAGPPMRTYQVRLTPFPDGVLAIAEDITAQSLMKERDAAARSYETLIEAMPGLAHGVINLRGGICSVSPGLAEMVGSGVGHVLGVRFMSLFHASVRAAVGDLVETVLGGGGPITTKALLNTDGAEPMPVTLGLSPQVRLGRCDGAIFIVQRDMAGATA